jgi:hypothetical protein
VAMSERRIEFDAGMFADIVHAIIAAE